MVENRRHPWLVVLLVGAFYCLVAGIAFTALAARSASPQMVFAWRLASFIVSVIAFALQIGYEHFRLRTRPAIVGLHTASAVALGAFGLAVAANVHAIGVANANHLMLALSLIIWPLMTGLPAFL